MAAEILGLIIHLDRAAARKGQVDWLRAHLPVPAEVVAAVDAREGAPDGSARYDPALGLRPPYPFPVGPTEIAAFLSHRRAWARIVESGAEAGLVVEDDVTLEAPFAAAWALAAGHAGPEALIRLPQKPRERPGRVIAEAGGARLFRPAQVALGMQATLVGREAAARLLAATERFDRPVDGVIQMPWVTGVAPLAVVPSGIRDISGDLGGSTLSKRGRGLAGRLWAEAARARYRLALARAARRAERAGGGPG